MLETLLTLTGMELGGFVLKQVLDLGKPVLEGYVRDFFEGCLTEGVAQLKASQLKTPMAEAVGVFLQQFVEELDYHDVPESSIDHFYSRALKRFVRDGAVASVLGKAFETGCKRIDPEALEDIWISQYQPAGCSFPEAFDWKGIAKNYVKAVKGIVKADGELRSLLETDLLEQIAGNTAQLSPGFDMLAYRKSLESSYGYLKLYTLDANHSMDQIRLWRMFIEQTVREALPPTRYDIPIDLKQKLQEEGHMSADLSAEALEHYQRNYLQQPVRKVLAAVAEVEQAVILGDPGSGKSTLLQYLALDWVEGKTDTLPLLIELREYALAPSKSFLDFLHSGRGVDWQFDQQQLHQHLQENSTLVMFDGLDEVFHHPTQAAVVDDIIRFAHQYPQARILVTSRIIDYNPERFQQAGFTQFTIQPLDDEEIKEFTRRWYDLAMGSDADKMRLKRRLQEAITNSKAIRNLADNPLLLTMMAILNRRQELPRDRADLYDQASRVLLYQWDVEHKRLELPADAIGRREKQDILRRVAYEMQAGEEGLKGNLISAERLTRVLTDYLKEQGFERSREKAGGLIKQLRERNFILCYRGADTYGFVHRTFLEYFCALEIVQRFEKQRSLSFEQLRDEVFGEHWQDEAWHEVLQLICGMIDPKLASQLTTFLTARECNQLLFLSELPWEEGRADPGGIRNLLLAADCMYSIGGKIVNSSVGIDLLQKLKSEAESPNIRLSFSSSIELLERIARCFPENLDWLKEQADKNSSSFIQFSAIKAIYLHFYKHPGVLSWLENWAKNGEDWGVRVGAVEALDKYYSHSGERVFKLFKDRAIHDEDWGVRRAAINAISNHYGNHHETFDFMASIVRNDPFARIYKWQNNPRQTAMEVITLRGLTHPETISLLRDRAINDPDEQLRNWAKQQLNRYEETPEIEGS